MSKPPVVRPNRALVRNWRAALVFLIACSGSARIASAQDAPLPADSLRRTLLESDFSYVSFNGQTDPWRTASVSLSGRSSRGSLIGRFNYANRFASNGTQFEVDAYPAIRKGTYGYLNVGYSASSIFPQWRWGAELFQSLPGAWEASVGARQLRFSGVPVTLFTGAIGKYTGNYWISIRTYEHEGGSASASVTVRRYFSDNLNYFGAYASFGSSPSDRITPDEILRTNSSNGGISGSHSISKRVHGMWSIDLSSETLSATTTRHSWSVSSGLSFIL